MYQYSQDNDKWEPVDFATILAELRRTHSHHDPDNIRRGGVVVIGDEYYRKVPAIEGGQKCT